MVFNSIDFLLFMPLIALVYYLIPLKYRYIWLLAASYCFYLSWNIKYIYFLLPITCLTFLMGIVIERAGGKNDPNIRSKLLLGAGIGALVGVLGILKYSEFFIFNVNRIVSPFGLSLKNPKWDLVLPVGISFYTLQSIGYLTDVYKRKVPAEKNILKYALFLSFFPIVMSGPIERAENLLKQIHEKISFQVENIRYGLLSFAWGLYLKLVMADSLQIVVDAILLDWHARPGCEIALAVALFGIQIYCDFCGYSHMAIGTARILGFQVRNNFAAPYLAENIKDFWRRWHISLTSWFTDYVYIPLGGNRKGTLRKYVNTLVVFGISGLWHGAGFNYILWGLLNGLYLIIYDLYRKWKSRKETPCSAKKLWGSRIGNSVLTFLAVDFAWFFFVMPDLGDALEALFYGIGNFQVHHIFSNEFFNVFWGSQRLFVLLFSMLLLLGVDTFTYQGKDFRTEIFRQPKIIRWIIYLGLVFLTIIWGAYGGAYEQKAFIYFNF